MTRKTRCWMSEREWSRRRGMTIAKEGDATCLLDDGHDGDHVFTPNEAIVLVFNAAPRPS